MKRPALFLLFAFFLSGLSAQQAGYYSNPVIRGDMPDPSVIRIGDTYYATGTSSEWAPFYPVYTSKDLVNWTHAGHVFDEKPLWTSNSFWAPELFAHNGRVYCYYTARRKSDNVSYIGVASAKSPLGKFTDHGPLVEYGTEAIDAFVYDDDGQLYISWKAYGLDKRPIELLASRLSDDGLRLEGEAFTLLTDDGNIGMEGQYHFRHGDHYYIIYAGKGCCGPGSDYDVRVARSKAFRGPYEIYEGNPILHGGAGDFLSCGHGTVVESPDGRMFYMCHAYLMGDGFFMGRQPIVQEMFMNDEGWPEFLTGRLAVAKQQTPFAGTGQMTTWGFSDDFDKPRLKVEWAWNYPYSAVSARIWKGKLMLTGTPEPDAQNGSVLCVRSTATDYTYETRVMNGNKSMKGLTMYGDDQNLVVWGVQDGRLLLKVIDDGQETVVYESRYGNYGTPWLRIGVESGSILTCWYSVDGKEWTKALEEPVDRRRLVRWDRVARPGLIHNGDPAEHAEFSYFRLINQ